MKTQQSMTLRPLPFTQIRPSGWLKTQMQQDFEGFVGNLDLLIPDLFNDPIYGKGRLGRNSPAKDLGNLKQGDARNPEQYKWWNSETQSNWWDGYLRHAFLLNNAAAIGKVERYVEQILATQDADGYLGIYTPEMRYQFQHENGELWAKTTLFRGLLAYYEATKQENVKVALVRAVENVMENYPIGASSPFDSGQLFNGGVSHGLTFTDVLDKMYQLTNDRRYWDYAAFLYQNFSDTLQSEKDAQLHHILNPNYQFQSHGVHTYEHLRPLALAALVTQQDTLQEALAVYLQRIEAATTPSGGAIGDEWIGERLAHATQTGYEFCSLHELLASYAFLLEKTGAARFGDAIERIFYNAAHGARHPSQPAIAYLKTDNSYEMMGTKNGIVEANRKQTRYKYSPVHQDVAVCCTPNAGRISPYFLQNSWLKQGETTLIAALLLPNVVQTTLQNTLISIENQTNYPHNLEFVFHLTIEKPLFFQLKIRKPNWATALETSETYRIEEDFIVIERLFQPVDTVKIRYLTEVRIATDRFGERYFSYGALLFALPIPAQEIIGRIYAKGFEDRYYQPLSTVRYACPAQPQPVYRNGKIAVSLLQTEKSAIENVTLVPFQQTLLRQTTFPNDLPRNSIFKP